MFFFGSRGDRGTRMSLLLGFVVISSKMITKGERKQEKKETQINANECD